MSIENAIRLSKQPDDHSDKSSLLKITLGSIQEKVDAFKNKLKLRSESNPSHVHKIFITPDYTRLEQKKIKALHRHLADMNKIENDYEIKNRQIHNAEDTLSVLSTDNHHTYPPDDLNNLKSLTINCQSLLL